MKKIRVSALLLLCLLVLLSACTKDGPTGDTSSAEPSGETSEWEEACRVTLTDARGVRYIGDVRSGAVLQAGETVRFRIEVSPFYEGTPTVTANGKPLQAQDGVYSVTLQGDTEIAVSGLSLQQNTLTGAGTDAEDPFVITSPVDLLFIAEQVNAGNALYRSAYYLLDADLDFGGALLEVIGDGLHEQSYFEGYFNGQGHTVSNFRIERNDTPYIGLFGILQANVANAQGGTVYALNLADFTVEARYADASMFCGSFAGYALGANLILCNATGGTVNVYGDVNNFAYAGGLVGSQQGLDYQDLTYLSALTYCSSDVEVVGVEGAVYSAGGITGYLAQSNAGVTASVLNCYSTGNVLGAMVSGGVVGYVGQNTCVANCYSTGTVSAQSGMSDLDNSERFCHAYAGGIAGYAEPDSILSECFASGTVYCKAQLGTGYEHSDGILGEKGVPGEGEYIAAPAVMYNCKTVNPQKDLNGIGQILADLHWNPSDWVCKAGAYPTVNTQEDTSYTFSVSIRFPGQEDVTVTEFDAYMPLQFWYQEDILPSDLTGPTGDTHTSYAYVFEDGSVVPQCYVPTHDLVITALVADYAEVAGSYVLLAPDPEKSAFLTLYTDGRFTYTDGGEELLSYYRYNGTDVIFRDARFARYSQTVWGITAYQFADYTAHVEDGRLVIVGGVLTDGEDSVTAFPSNAPLIAMPSTAVLTGAYYTGNTVYTFSANGNGTKTENGSAKDFTYTRNGSSLTLRFGTSEQHGSVQNGHVSVGGVTLRECDPYRGSWNIDSVAHKEFTFDGAGNWSYAYYAYRDGSTRTVLERSSGRYTLRSDGSVSLSGGFAGEIKLIDGALVLQTAAGSLSCHRAGSYCGTWVYPEYDLTLYLYGIGADGSGSARAEYRYPDETVEFYALTCSLGDFADGRLCLYYNGELFGLLRETPGTDVLDATVFVSPLGSFMQNVPLQRFDDLQGEWVGEWDGMAELVFDGKAGEVRIGETETAYTLENRTLSGSFLYNGRVYLLSYDNMKKTLSVSDGTDTTVYQRKDAFASCPLADAEGRSYVFDGRGALPNSYGSLTVTAPDGGIETYSYRVGGNGVTLYQNGSSVGSIEPDRNTQTYRLRLNGERSLRIRTAFTGTWAMSGSLENLIIGEADLNGNASGSVNGRETSFRTEQDYLTFTYADSIFYILRVGESNLVISQSPEWYRTSDPIFCAPVDELFGTWTNSLGASYAFDGMSGSTLTGGTAQAGLETDPISYYYQLDSYGQYVLWTTDENGTTLLYRLVFCDTDTRRAFVQGERAFTVQQGDNLYDSVFTDSESGISYTFDGFGKVAIGEDRSGTYTVDSLDQNTGIAHVQITEDGTTRKATLDFSNPEGFTLTFEA